MYLRMRHSLTKVRHVDKPQFSNAIGAEEIAWTLWLQGSFEAMGSCGTKVASHAVGRSVNVLQFETAFWYCYAPPILPLCIHFAMLWRCSNFFYMLLNILHQQ